LVTTIAGRYQLDPVHIGRGGMGEVWGGTDTRLRRRVAVKFISFPDGTPDPELISRFVRESQLTARMDHPGVPVIYDAARVGEGPFEGRLYLVMQLIDGINVDDLVAEHDPLPIGWAVAIAAQTCAVLSYAHDKQLIHRDLKPSNLMLSRDGTVKVLDFGLAVALDASDRSKITRTNQMVGTLAYMAPEQFRNEPSPRSDFYALGCVLHRMLTGRLPFDGPTEASIMHAQIYDDPTPARELRSDVPAGLEALVLRLLAKKPEERPASADEIYGLLMPYLNTLEELPGAVRPGPNASRMYAGVVGRVFSAPTTAVQPKPAPKPPSAVEPEPISLGDVARARRQAERLTRESRFDEAAQMLTRIAAKAGPLLGAEHSDVIGLRIDLANVLLTGGEYAKAATAFQRLSQDLARRDGPDTELVMRFRFQEATCHAALGDSDLALRQLERLLADELRVYGEDDSRVTELREQIALLLHGTGRTPQALQGLEKLALDLERRYGSEHPHARNVRETIRRMKKN
jgi:eukaryotic-like serine/threonine-protein kinase